MFELDDKFFEEIGLNAMPQNEKESFKNHVQEEIQVRVGERISDGMTIEKMQEFENIKEYSLQSYSNYTQLDKPIKKKKY